VVEAQYSRQDNKKRAGTKISPARPDID